MEIDQKDQIETKLPVCTVEYDAINGVVYAGAYCLDDGETSERHGQLTSYELDEDGKFVQLNAIETGAILDMKIENDRLFVVDDRGQLSVYQLEQKKCERLEQSTVTQGLLLSISVRQGQIATSSSVGSISVIDAATMKETGWLPCHDDAEAWIVTIGPNNQLFTGGDDSYFRIWDLKSHEPIVEKKFMAGQTSCEWHPEDENLLVQGGYDDTIRLWDLRTMKTPLSEQLLKGGVWRTRFNGRNVLVPCMYENAQMVALDENKLSKVWKSECHKSITYGACWLPERKLFCTSSFYDKKLVSWGYAE